MIIELLSKNQFFSSQRKKLTKKYEPLRSTPIAKKKGREVFCNFMKFKITPKKSNTPTSKQKKVVVIFCKL